MRAIWKKKTVNFVSNPSDQLNNSQPVIFGCHTQIANLQINFEKKRKKDAEIYDKGNDLWLGFPTYSYCNQ